MIVSVVLVAVVAVPVTAVFFVIILTALSAFDAVNVTLSQEQFAMEQLTNEREINFQFPISILLLPRSFSREKTSGYGMGLN